MSSNSVWKISGDTAMARWQNADRNGNDAEITVDTHTPVHGARLKFGDDELTLFALEQITSAADSAAGSERRSDLYVRGDDVIMRFESSQHPFEREIYWRVVEDEVQYDQTFEDEADDADDAADEADEAEGLLFGLEMIYSLQTDELDTRPAPQAVSNLPIKSFKAYAAVGAATDAQRTWAITDDLNRCQLVLAKLDSGNLLAIGVFPSDLRRLELDNQVSPSPIAFHLKTEFLEKGVIRRIRMFVCGSDNAENESELLARATYFLNSEIPLTT